MILIPAIVTRRVRHFSSPAVLAPLHCPLAGLNLVNAEVVFQGVVAANV